MARPGSGVMVSVNGLGYPPQNLARVVVWEWLNEHGRWRPYSAAVCHHIENVLKGGARHGGAGTGGRAAGPLHHRPAVHAPVPPGHREAVELPSLAKLGFTSTSITKAWPVIPI
ncbi:hypothetical protein AAFF_G00023360 [Aldrovandia affinis]|uniref:WWE domain-containing protein n=1 Tax=Aldrovandia affinis TaxID=143900 RepID=A0AAD7T6D4_9TELE|nr:hypothetical protein AAFF_G00023360 [Aldrovandia affinis]